MPPSARLSGAEIRTFRAQRRFHGALLSVGVAPLPGGKQAKVGVIVSKKVAAKAHDRNALKRLLREALRSVRSTLPPLAILVTLKQGAAHASKTELRTEIAKIVVEVGAMARA